MLSNFRKGTVLYFVYAPMAILFSSVFVLSALYFLARVHCSFYLAFELSIYPFFSMRVSVFPSVAIGPFIIPRFFLCPPSLSSFETCYITSVFFLIHLFLLTFALFLKSRHDFIFVQLPFILLFFLDFYYIITQFF